MTPREIYTRPDAKLYGMRRGNPLWAQRQHVNRPYAWTERLYRLDDGWYAVREEHGGEAGCYIDDEHARAWLEISEEEEAARHVVPPEGCANCWKTGSRTIRAEQPCQWCGTSPSYVWPHALDR